MFLYNNMLVFSRPEIMADEKNIPEIIVGGEIRLERLRPEMADEIYAIVDGMRHEVSRFMNFMTPEYCLDDCSSFAEESMGNWDRGLSYPFVIKEEIGKIVGVCDINRIDRINSFANLGYWVAKEHWGKGIATGSASLAARFGFEHLGLARIEIFMSVENPASRRVAEKLGAKQEGTLRSRLLLQGRRHDAWLFSLLPEDIS